MKREAESQGQYPPLDDYRAPPWLQCARAIFFEGYAPPVYPEVRNFDARRLVEVSQELGGDTLRFQPVGYRATYPSKVFPTFPELGSRDLIDEVSRECRRVGLHLYCYCIMAGGLDATVIHDPRYAPFVLRDVNGNPPKRTTGYGNGQMVTMCGTGDPYRQMIRTQARELCEHDTDGIYFDAPSGYRGVCFCDSCRVGFKKYSGMDPERLRNVLDLQDLPEDTDMKALSVWYDWANKITEEDLVDLRRSSMEAGSSCSATTAPPGGRGAFIPSTGTPTASWWSTARSSTSGCCGRSWVPPWRGPRRSWRRPTWGATTSPRTDSPFTTDPGPPTS